MEKSRRMQDEDAYRPSPCSSDRHLPLRGGFAGIQGCRGLRGRLVEISRDRQILKAISRHLRLFAQSSPSSPLHCCIVAPSFRRAGDRGSNLYSTKHRPAPLFPHGSAKFQNLFFPHRPEASANRLSVMPWRDRRQDFFELSRRARAAKFRKGGSVSVFDEVVR